MLNLESLSLSLYSEHTSKARERKREVACLHAIRQTSQSARKVPVNYLSASVRERGGSRRPIATIKVVRAAYYSHVRIRRETPRFPSSPSIRRGCLGETDLFLARFFVARPLLLLPRDVYGARRTERAFLRSRGGGRERFEDRSADIFQRRMVGSFVARTQLLERGRRDGYWVGFLSSPASR